MARGIGGGATGELYSFANADCRGRSGEVGADNFGVDNDFGLGAALLSVQSDGTGIGAGIGQGAVGAGDIPSCGCPSARTRPRICGTTLGVATEGDGLAYAVRTAAFNQRRHDATVGGASANVLKMDSTLVVAKIGKEQNVVFPRYGVVDVAMFVTCSTNITTINNFTA